MEPGLLCPASDADDAGARWQAAEARGSNADDAGAGLALLRNEIPMMLMMLGLAAQRSQRIMLTRRLFRRREGEYCQ